MKSVLAATILLSISAPAFAKPLECKWDEKSQCDPGKGCRPISVGTSFVTLDPQKQEYKRCDRNGCDAYQTNVNVSGMFTNYDLTGRGVFAKVGANGLSTEVVSLGNSVLVSQGICR